MRTVLTLLLTSVWLILPGTAQQGPVFMPVASAKQLMEAIIIPASDTIFNFGSEAPKSGEEWTAVKNSAIALAESGNLLMIGSRAPDNKAWTRESQSLTAAAIAAIKAIDARNIEALLEASDQIYGVCESCHEQYMKK